MFSPQIGGGKLDPFVSNQSFIGDNIFLFMFFYSIQTLYLQSISTLIHYSFTKYYLYYVNTMYNNTK